MSPPPQILKPPLKWVGGKTQIIHEVLSTFPQDINNYYEPFLGGGSVLLAFLSYVKAGKIALSGNVYASDLNSNIIALYNNIKYHCEALITEVTVLQNAYDEITGTIVNRKATTVAQSITSRESFYYYIRHEFNRLTPPDRLSVKGSAMMLFLNKACFRGIYREGPNGFNVPFGHYKQIRIIDESINNLSELIQNVTFRHQSFQQALNFEQPENGADFVYVDPPYAPENANSFVGYTATGFALSDHEALFAACKQLATKGATFVMSNAAVPLVTDAFPAPEYETQVISCRRAINSKNPAARTNEVIIRKR